MVSHQDFQSTFVSQYIITKDSLLYQLIIDIYFEAILNLFLILLIIRLLIQLNIHLLYNFFTIILIIQLSIKIEFQYLLIKP